MATDIVASLFGVTPEMYQQRQMAQADERALQYAQLTPFQQANYAISRGAYGLAGALGGALGAQDPQLQLISQRNAIARQIDYNNPASIMEGQRLLARVGDTVGALQLANVARDLEYKQAQTTQSLAAAGASRAQAAKSQAEIDKIDRQQRAFAQLTGAKPAEAAAPAAVPAAAAAPEAQPLYSINEQSLANLPGDVQNLIQIKLEDAARLRADTTDPQSARAALRLRQAEMLEEQAARTFLANRPDLRRLTSEESKDAISQRKFNNPIYYTLSDSQRAAVDKEFDAASEKAQLAQAKQSLGFQFAPTAAATAPAPAAVIPAAAAAPAAAASTRASISQQIAALENRRKQFLALTEIPDAKAEAEILGDQIKDLREQLKPTEIAKLDREIDQFRAEGVPDTDPRIKTRLDKIAKLSTPTSERFGTDREAISKEKFFKPFAELTQAQVAVVNAEFEERQGRKAEKGAPKVYQQGQQVEPKDWIKFEEYIEKQPTFKRTASIISAAPSVLRTIKQATSNDFAARALPASIARLFDEGTLSNQDVKNYAITGGLDDRLASLASNFFTGTVTSVTKQQAEQFMTAIYRGALLDQKDIYIDRARRLGYADSPNYLITIQQLDKELAKFREVQPAPATGAGTASGAGGRTMSRQEEEALLRRYGQNPGQNTR